MGDDSKRIGSGKKRALPGRLTGYAAAFGERFLRLEQHGQVHLKGRGGIWYVYDYYKDGDERSPSKEEAERIRNLRAFLDGDRKYYPYFYTLFARAIRQVLWITKLMGTFELVSVPRSDPDELNPVAEVCRAIAGNEKFLLARAIDGSGLIKRMNKMRPVHRGGRYTTQQIKENLALTRPLKAKKVILVDDMVFSGKTIAACSRLLKENGAAKVCAVCLYGYKRTEKKK